MRNNHSDTPAITKANGPGNWTAPAVAAAAADDDDDDDDVIAVAVACCKTSINCLLFAMSPSEAPVALPIMSRTEKHNEPNAFRIYNVDTVGQG